MVLFSIFKTLIQINVYLFLPCLPQYYNYTLTILHCCICYTEAYYGKWCRTLNTIFYYYHY